MRDISLISINLLMHILLSFTRMYNEQTLTIKDMRN